MKALIVLAMLLSANANIFFLKDNEATCPKWTCNTGREDICLVAVGTKTDGRTITTNPCNIGKACQFNPEIILTDSDITETCSLLHNSIPGEKAYPGETCTKDDDCLKIIYWDPTTKTYAPKQMCADYLCVGNKVSDNCRSHVSCTVGNYCTGNTMTEGQCEPQLADSSQCVDDYACQNASVCFHSKCTAPSTQEVGTQLENPGQSRICKSEYTTSDNICAYMIYDSSKHSKISKGLVKCGFDSTCNYVEVISPDGKITRNLTKKCSCPANGDGQGYCPLAINDLANFNIINSLSTGLQTRFNNGLHTLNRGKFGPKTPEYASDNCFLYYNLSLSLQFYKSQQCATNVLSFDVSKCTLLS